MPQPSILIIGAGIIGAAAALYLSENGISVTVIDKREIGHGCSYGNAGWIVPAHAVPLPAPGAVRQGLKWMLNPDSPLYIKPRPNARLIRWLWRFSRSANQQHFERGAKILMPFARHSLDLYKQFVVGHLDQTLGFQQRGLLQVCQTEAALHRIQHEAQLAAQFAMPSRSMTPDQLRQFEPALQGPAAGAVYLPDEADAEPLAMVRAMAHAAAARGAVFLPNTEVYDIERNGRRITALHTTAGKMTADQYVLAAGSWSPQFAKSLALNIPIQGGKGYALILDPIDPAPRGPILLVESKVAVTPRSGSLRLAGTMELAGLNESITPRRIRAILNGARQFLHVPTEPRITEIWRGLRPCTPDGLPIIGRPHDWENLTLAAGHAMLGLTLGAATGRLVADILTGTEPLVDPTPFIPDRF